MPTTGYEDEHILFSWLVTPLFLNKTTDPLMKALIYFNQLGIVPIVSIILFLTSLSFDSTSYQINNFTTWLLLYVISPIWLGQPISLESVRHNLILFLQLIGYATLYKKQQNTAMALLTASCLSSSILLVLDQGWEFCIFWKSRFEDNF